MHGRNLVRLDESTTTDPRTELNGAKKDLRVHINRSIIPEGVYLGTSEM